MQTRTAILTSSLIACGLFAGLTGSALADKITYVVPNKVWVKQADLGNGVHEMVIHNRIENKQITMRLDTRIGPTQGVWMPTYIGPNNEKPLGNLRR